jgi:3-hydroxyisobutyrate dehydrogenase and related beta-hydroxyacid dehydrogenases
MAAISKVGFIGLGVMGGPMAANMKAKGSEEIIVHDISPELLKKYGEMGMTAASSYKDICAADIIFLSLPNSKIVEAVLFGADGLFENLHEGHILVDLSTIKYSTTLEIDRKVREKGVIFLDAPVSGMGARAVEGTLAVMCGGDERYFEIARPFFERIATNVQYMGKIGNGQLMKLINQLLFDINIAAVAEILPFALKMGLDPEKTVSIVNSGTARSFASEFFAPRILKDNFGDGYTMGSAYKDLESASEICASMCLPLPVLNAATQTYQAALIKGYGKEDKGSMVKVFEELFDVKFRV